MFSRYEVLFTLNGPQFSSVEMKEFAEAYGFYHITMSLYYPQVNG